MVMIYETSMKDPVYRYQNAIVISFNGKRNVLSTSPLNGGYREDIKAVFNQGESANSCTACKEKTPAPKESGCKMRAPTYEEHLAIIAKELGLDASYTTGLSTAAFAENAAIVEEKHKSLTVTAIVTGGVEVNGGRVGDPASFDEMDKKVPVREGTINIILLIDANLPPGTLTRALVTCTEAKTAALQELMAQSNYSSGLATGSGTDGTIVVSNMESDIHLTWAGKHSKLGELIGRVVIKAVKEALYKQTGLSPQMQHSLLRRIKRYKVTEETMWNRYRVLFGDDGYKKFDFMHNLHLLDRQEDLVTLTSLYVHLLDQLQWGLLNKREVKKASEFILKEIAEDVVLEKADPSKSDEDFIKDLLELYEETLISRIRRESGV
ncbi:adenosylcobinamide amidohydrolase CbiZ [Thermoanaerobacter kivui]|uniref:Adenosylcobinamide amidohydrolase CbiZ n=1 Tax=Thermoanaerobacter kivui TaxID=2325 RepID=A0A097ANW9_THEKI|nr:adenosylcobinamide amidohydrolase [Thermoanaerobacter kivui]AIS51512.1 adenosylcobinamide amidohydrolase CbiZ [Thermoanaerobacter kivui]